MVTMKHVDMADDLGTEDVGIEAILALQELELEGSLDEVIGIASSTLSVSCC